MEWELKKRLQKVAQADGRSVSSYLCRILLRELGTPIAGPKPALPPWAAPIEQPLRAAEPIRVATPAPRPPPPAAYEPIDEVEAELIEEFKMVMLPDDTFEIENFRRKRKGFEELLRDNGWLPKADPIATPTGVDQDPVAAALEVVAGLGVT
jgi:hypothetical protein